MTKKDVKFIIVLCIVSILSGVAFFINTALRAKKVEEVSVYYQNEPIMTFDISKDAYYYLTGNYGKMTIEVKDEKYRVINVECPNHDCEHIGWVKKGSPTIILCVPNDVFITQNVEQ